MSTDSISRTVANVSTAVGGEVEVNEKDVGVRRVTTVSVEVVSESHFEDACVKGH